jgi:lantibiotic modifying enzyme
VCALAELARATGEERFAAAVEEGLRYEQSQFSSEEGNWRDYRADAADVDSEAYQFGWCHGAPGIGMARFRLIELGFDSPAIRQDLDVALATTERKLDYADSPGQRDFCICHGLAGNAELPLLISNLPGHESLREKAERVGQLGVDRFEKTGMPWPYNLGGTGETPSLFCGMAGIGYFYLRLWRPDRVPSILLLRPPHTDCGEPVSS